MDMDVSKGLTEAANTMARDMEGTIANTTDLGRSKLRAAQDSLYRLRSLMRDRVSNATRDANNDIKTLNTAENDLFKQIIQSEINTQRAIAKNISDLAIAKGSKVVTSYAASVPIPTNPPAVPFIDMVTKTTA